jgi:8-oxo-dGTP pyrophosphatase MutT (NUDIX family)
VAEDQSKLEFSKRIAAGKGDATKLVAAATVVLLRDSPEGLETLMLRKNSKIAFGGMWVFPGGRIDDEDGAPDDPMEQRARIAAVREAEEEASLQLEAPDLVWFSHWTPPQVEIRRFSTWFFAARAPDGDVKIDDGEIKESQWIRLSDALDKQREGEIELVPPTFVTLHTLARYERVDAALSGLAAKEPHHYVTKIAGSHEGMVILWQEDAGYEAGDASLKGPHHRLLITKQGFVFDDSALG